MSGAPISWRSRKQTIVAVSTCEAEYISLSTAFKEAIWLRNLVHSLLSGIKEVQYDFEQPTTIHSDNQGAIALASNESINNRNKHIDIAYHYVRDVVKQGTVKLIYIQTSEMAADMFTKALPRIRFTANVAQLGLS